MNNIVVLCCLFLFAASSCNNKKQNPYLEFKKELNEPLKEISGMITHNEHIYAIADKPKAVFYRINKDGEVEQQINIAGVQVQDVEAITADEEFFYIGDVGDNDGNRAERKIVKVAKSSLGTGDVLKVKGEVISFELVQDSINTRKKKNNHDCEAMVSLGDSIYLFTKRRSDMQTELFSIPKTPGRYKINSLKIFDCVGLVTDAAVNKQKNELALSGYNKGHHFPFIIFFKNFKGNNFFTGIMERIELADKAWDWQIESVTYDKDNKVLFACEETPEVKATLYAVKRDKIFRLNKKR